MAGIDKTYTDSYKDYKELVDWVKDKKIEFHTGQTIKMSDVVWDLEEGDFSNGEMAVMNTSTYVDIFLIQNCPVNFVQDRMKEVYSEETFKEYKEMVFPKPLNPEYKRNRKIKISMRGDIPLFNKGLGSHKKWWLQSDIGWTYHEEDKVCSSYDDLLPSNTNTSHHKTIKSLVRFLRKQHLPKGLKFHLIGRYDGEDFEIEIK